MFKNKYIALAFVFSLLASACHHPEDEIKRPPNIPAPPAPTSSKCSKDYETFENAINITDGTNFSHSGYICYDGVMMYKLTVDIATIYTVTLSFDEADDLDLYILDEDEEELASTYYNNPEIIEDLSLAPGEYYIAAFGYKVSTSHGVPYTLTVTGIPTCSSDEECDTGKYCNIYLGGVCTTYCQTNDDCHYVELSCAPDSKKCVWGECLTNNDCAIFKENSPRCTITRDDQNFDITRYCTSEAEIAEHCGGDDDLLEAVAETTQNNDNFLAPYAIKIKPGESFEQKNLKVCNKGEGDFYQIEVDSSSDSVIDVEITVTGSSSLYFIGSLLDPASGRILDGGSFDIADWELCQKGKQIPANCTTDASGKETCTDTKFTKECNLLITFRALKWPASKPLLFMVSRFSLALEYDGSKDLNAILTDVTADTPSTYEINIKAENGVACTTGSECNKVAYPRTKCNKYCYLDSSFRAYKAAVSEPCLDYLDCNIRDNFDYFCSITNANAEKNFCTFECKNAANCASFHGGEAGDYICSGHLCYHSACDTADDCPRNDAYHKYCQAGSCIECRTDSDCTNNPGFTVCDPTWKTCNVCLTNEQCAGNNAGKLCLTVERDDPYRVCGCQKDEDCAETLGHKCNKDADSSIGSCGCEKDEHCAGGYSCLTIVGKCYKKS